MKDIEEICNRIIIIDKGVIVVDCPVDELKQSHNKTVVVKLNLNALVLGFNIAGAKGTSEAEGLKWTFDQELGKNH